MSSGNRQVSQRSRVPLPGNCSMQRWPIHDSSKNEHIQSNVNAAGEKALCPQTVKDYLIQHPKELQQFILELTDSVKLEELLNKKRQSEELQSGIEAYRTPAIQKQFLQHDVKTLCSVLIKQAAEEDLTQPLMQMAHMVAQAVGVDGFSVYIPEHNDKDLLECFDNGDRKPYGPVGYGMTVAAHAAEDKKMMCITDVTQDARFPNGVGRSDSHVASVLCIPAITPMDDLLGILELTRDSFKKPFNENDIQTVNAVMGWMTSCVHQQRLNDVLITQQKLNDFLLDKTKIMFNDMISPESLIQNIMIYTKQLVHAERCSLFLVDDERDELYAEYFEDIKDPDNSKLTVNAPPEAKRSQIRFPKSKGIAGFVADTGEIVNIYDCYADSRFNHDVDRLTGYHTKNLLCMPIITKNQVIGVVQMLNCTSTDHFTHAHVEAFKMFAVYCALALHYSNVYSKLKIQEDQFSVALEVLYYHFQCPNSEYKALLANPYLEPRDVPPKLDTFDFYCYSYEDDLPRIFIHMLVDLFGRDTFEISKLCRFMLTVRKNYRPVEYHNWKHGFHVGHSIYCMVKKTGSLFSTQEAQALVIAAVCHDLDHRGYNNAFIQKLKQPLAALYSTSVMEQHHYKMAVTIIQHEGHDIFSFLNASAYKKMLKLIREAIIATDLALYFPNQKALAGMVKDGSFDITNPDMRSRLKSLMMTGGDLCAVAKPWATQQDTVSYIYEEFYFQGDEEKKHGLEPIPMMDRNKKDEIPKQQVGFIQFICLPLYTTLSDILPETYPLLEQCKDNLINWQHIVAFKEEELRARVALMTSTN